MSGVRGQPQNALEDAGFGFIVAARQSRAPAELEDHFEAHGNYVPDGDTFEVTRPMGIGKDRRDRRVVWHYLAARARRDQQTLNKQIRRAEKIAAGQAPIGKHRFVKLEGATKGVDWGLVARARTAAGFKGYVTNLNPDLLDGPAVVAAFRDLWQVTASFRTAKSDLAARPIFQRTRNSTEAHLTVVFAALAVGRTIQARTGLSIKKFLQTLQPLQSALINTGTHSITVPPAIPPEAQEILDLLTSGGVHQFEATPVKRLNRGVHRVCNRPQNTAPRDHRGPVVRTVETVQTLLTAAEVDHLDADYERRADMQELAEKYGIHRATVFAHLRWREVTRRRPGLSDHEQAEAVRLSRDGMSMRAIGRQMGVDRKAVRVALVDAGVIADVPLEAV